MRLKEVPHGASTATNVVPKVAKMGLPNFIVVAGFIAAAEA
jgi:hypothetical protein